MISRSNTTLRLGDVAHGFVLFNTTAFVAAVLLHALGKLDIFSTAFQEEGFCIANKDASFTLAGYALPLSSHGLSFYSDFIFALGIFFLARSRKDDPAMRPVVNAVFLDPNSWILDPES